MNTATNTAIQLKLLENALIASRQHAVKHETLDSELDELYLTAVNLIDHMLDALDNDPHAGGISPIFNELQEAVAEFTTQYETHRIPAERIINEHCDTGELAECVKLLASHA